MKERSVLFIGGPKHGRVIWMNQDLHEFRMELCHAMTSINEGFYAPVKSATTVIQYRDSGFRSSEGHKIYTQDLPVIKIDGRALQLAGDVTEVQIHLQYLEQQLEATRKERDHYKQKFQAIKEIANE
ncbi:hypothetical protein [Achromobacter phage Motura]|uniref:Uncharacterized protein n=1 Tax=Achromobacter phage Motura TaxID=2591403 RepID=A0A514CT58_9CAUD|nr:hypothetical protein H1O15_gp083 [Achromobacter phage Motura]QDH83667.1 hypothetical protein [Achromobacter phage Motura]